MISVFTLCSNNYLAQAIVLGQTLLKFNPAYNYTIGLVDRKSDSIEYSEIPFEILQVENLGIPYFDEMSSKYNVIELNTAVKPFYFQHFFKNPKVESAVYLDPDIQVFAPFSELENELSENDIIITPHFTTPLNDNKWQAEEDFLNSGIYNLGFIGIKNTSIGNSMVQWWADRLKNKAYMNFHRGLFYDQIWINFVPLFFDRVKIFTHPGYNAAYWNLHERYFINESENYLVNTNFPLVFYHYAGYRPLENYKISNAQNRFSFEERLDIKPLFDNYRTVLFQNNYESYTNHKCYFSELKDTREEKLFREKIKKIPLIKKAIARVLREIINRLGLVMNYNSLR